MTLWFGPFIDLEPGHGYFHLCPACFGECVAPNLEDVQETLIRLHPSTAAYLERERAADAGRAADEPADATASGSDHGEPATADPGESAAFAEEAGPAEPEEATDEDATDEAATDEKAPHEEGDREAS